MTSWLFIDLQKVVKEFTQSRLWSNRKRTKPLNLALNSRHLVLYIQKKLADCWKMVSSVKISEPHWQWLSQVNFVLGLSSQQYAFVQNRYICLLHVSSKHILLCMRFCMYTMSFLHTLHVLSCLEPSLSQRCCTTYDFVPSASISINNWSDDNSVHNLMFSVRVCRSS